MHCSITAEISVALPFHQHVPHELIVCGSDEGELELDSHAYRYIKGQTFLIPAGVRHRVKGAPDAKAATQFICFDESFAASLGIMPLENYLRARYLNFSVCAQHNSSCFDENLALGRKLQQELDNPTQFSDVMAKSVLAQLLVNHCRMAKIPSVVKNNSKSFQIERCCEFIISHPAQPISLDNMAKMAGMSRSGFAQHFKSVTGKSLVEFTTLVRLQKACQMLSHSDESATHIAFSCGFGNLGHFYSVFKKQFDMTPVDYRNWAIEQQTESTAVAQ